MQVFCNGDGSFIAVPLLRFREKRYRTQMQTGQRQSRCRLFNGGLLEASCEGETPLEAGDEGETLQETDQAGGQQDWRLVTGVLSWRSVEPGEQEAVDTWSEEAAAAQELKTAAAQTQWMR